MTVSRTGPGTSFKSPQTTLGGIDIETAANIIATASDVALVIDRDGVIQDAAFAGEEMASEPPEGWIGQRWADTVTPESRPKIDELLEAAKARGPMRWRQVTHPSPSGGRDVPVLYAAIQAGDAAPIVAIGRDLRAVAALQQRLIEAQHAIERDFARLRQAETRYRLLFQMASEAVLVVDVATRKIVEANPAAIDILRHGGRKIVGRNFVDAFDRDCVPTLEQALSAARAKGRSDDVSVSLRSGESATVSASMFRQSNAAHFLVRLSPLDATPTAARGTGALSALVERAPDAFVVADLSGRVLSANAAFIDLAQVASPDQAIGEPIERWLGRPGVDVPVMSSELSERGAVRMFSTILRGDHGSVTDIEVSAVAAPEEDPPCAAYVMRSVATRLGGPSSQDGALPTNVERFADLVGRVPLKEIVRETTDVIERLCIEAALETTGDNRASAAEMLGLSRQSLYVKLRRYGLGDLDGDAGD